ncbi:hypothetical protein QBC43DRAFT_327720 [Cladorrhinum sp. PSN259]|nr:hypothetical protein QBC43DRAFT_327720 [Cladorrhinum sp. PSN259]
MERKGNFFVVNMAYVCVGNGLVKLTATEHGQKIIWVWHDIHVAGFFIFIYFSRAQKRASKIG